MAILKTRRAAQQKPMTTKAALLPFNANPVFEVVDAVTKELDRTSETVRTWSELTGWLDDHSRDGVIASLPDEEPPITSAQLDEVIEEADIDANSLRALRKAQKLVAAVEKAWSKKPKTPSAPVTRAEFDALAGIVGAMLAAASAAQGHSTFPHSSFEYQFERVQPDTMSELQRAVLNQVNKALKTGTEAIRSAYRKDEQRRSNGHGVSHYRAPQW